jgi:Uma2 family endonuclease
MATGIAVPVEQYLRTSYDPDCEYADGELIERNVGEFPHSRMQGSLYSYFRRRRKLWGIVPVVEQRVQIRENKYLVPDVCVIHGPEPTARILTEPPLIWIEVLSSEDRPIRVNKKVREALAFGTKYVWVIDPETLESYVATQNSQTDLTDGIFRIDDLGIVVPLFEVDAED